MDTENKRDYQMGVGLLWGWVKKMKRGKKDPL